MLEHNFVVWGTKCKYGNNIEILVTNHHPWVEDNFTIKTQCNKCGNEVIIDRSKAEQYYNKKIYDKFSGLSGQVLDLGCGGGFLSSYAVQQINVNHVYGIDIDNSCLDGLNDLRNNAKFNFINSDICNINKIFKKDSLDFLISRDVFMFVADTNKFFDDVTNMVTNGILQMGWYIKDNQRMQNHLLPEEIVDEYKKRGWKVSLEYLDWYKCGYFIKALK